MNTLRRRDMLIFTPDIYPKVGENILPKYTEYVWGTNFRVHDRDGNILDSQNSPFVIIPHKPGATYEYYLPYGGWRKYTELYVDYYKESSRNFFHNGISSTQYSGYNPSQGTITSLNENTAFILFNMKNINASSTGYIRRLT